jgi:hypothetical protein
LPSEAGCENICPVDAARVSGEGETRK